MRRGAAGVVWHDTLRGAVYTKGAAEEVGRFGIRLRGLEYA